MSNRNKEDIYDVSSYSDKELYDLLDLINPTDRELEAKIIFMIKKYNSIDNETGNRLARFFTDIYNRFFDNQDEGDEEENINMSITENFENIDNNNNDGSEDVQKLRVPTKTLSQQENKNEKEPGKSAELKTGEKEIGFIKPLDYAPDQLNPLLTQTIKRIISVDSQYRDDKTSMTTNFSFNLSTPLKDVVSLKLYSVQIPYTWYTISKSFGSNFFYLKGNKPGIKNNPSQDMFFDISAGNYTAQELVSAVNDSFFGNTAKNKVGKSDVYTDVSFGKTVITYDSNTSLANMNFDIKKHYNENSYYLNFANLTSPNREDEERIDSIPAFLGFNYQTYQLNTINSELLAGYDPDPINPELSESILDNIESYIVKDDNKSFDIYQYIGEYNSGGTISNYQSNYIQKITISLSLQSEAYYSRNAIFNDLSDQLFNSVYLSKESYIKRINITDTNVKNNGNSYFQLRIKLNRYTTQNVENSKVCLQFPSETSSDIKIWTQPGLEKSTSCFNFKLQADNITELNSITGETSAVQQTINYSIVGNPRILLSCIAENFVSPLNDIEITVESSPANQDYLISEYIQKINNGIIDATNIKPFLNGPKITNKTSEYTNYTYAYIDSADKFNLQVKIQKVFDQNMYRLDLNDTFLYKNLKLGDDEDGNIITTENDTLSIKGYIENNNLNITSNSVMPKVDLNNVEVKISFDVSSSTFGGRLPYGNIYLSKTDSNYLDSNINMNWNVNGRTFIITEDTYFVTSDRFVTKDKSIKVNSKTIDISSNSFSINGDHISMIGNSITLPMIPYDVSSIYFDNKNYFLNFTNSRNYSSTINGNSWIINGNSWFIDENDNWRVIGNTFINNEQNWNITNRLFVLTKTNQNNENINTVELSGNLITVNGNNFTINSSSTSQLALTYNNDYNYFNINGNLYSLQGNDINVTSNFINTNSTFTNPIVANSYGLNLFNNTIQLPSHPGNTLAVNGNNIIIKGSSGNSFDVSCNRLGLLYPGNTYNIIGDSFDYINTSLTINNGNLQLSNNIEITSNLLSIYSNGKIVVNNSINNFTITGSRLSLSSGYTNNYFIMEANNLSITSKTFTLYNSLDICIATNNIELHTDNNILLEGTRLSVSDIGWNVSGDVINYNNLAINYDTSESFDNTFIVNGSIKVKGNDFYIPNNNNPIIYYNSSSTAYTLSSSTYINTDNIKIVPVPNIDVTPTRYLLDMQVDISSSKIYSSDNIYISAVNNDNGQDNGYSFIIDTSYISLSNSPTKSLVFYANSLQHSSLSASNRISFGYSEQWTLTGTYFKLDTVNFTITSDTTNSNITQTPGSTTIELNNDTTKNLYINGGVIYYNNLSYTYNGTIKFVKGINMVLKSAINPFLINIGSFKVRGNTIICPPPDGGTTDGILYLDNNNLLLNGNIVSTTYDNILTVDTSNTSLKYKLISPNIKIEGRNLCINDRILRIECILSRPVTVTSTSDIKASDMLYISGNKNLILGNITSDNNGTILRVKKDESSYLFGVIPIKIPTFVPTKLSIKGNLLDLTNNSLSVIGNDVQLDNSMNMNGTYNSFRTNFNKTNYPVDYVKLSSPSFYVNNTDLISSLLLTGDLVVTNGSKWIINGSSVDVYQNNANWKINGYNITVNDATFQLIDTSFTMFYNNFSIPDNNKLQIFGNTFNINNNIFTTSSNTIEIDTNIGSPVSYSTYNSKIYNIYSENFIRAPDTISFNMKNNVTTEWAPNSSVGFDTSVTLLNFNNSTTFVSGNSLSIRSNGTKNFTVTTSSPILDISADTLKTFNTDERITYIGKIYKDNNIAINLGTPLNPYDFSINVVYNRQYLPLTNVASYTKNPSLIIPAYEKILTIYPRFNDNIRVFGNENDVGYNIVNTDKAIITNSISDLGTALTNLITSFKDVNGVKILAGSKVVLNKNTTRENDITIDCSLNLVVSKTLNRADYAIKFSNYKDSHNVLYETWKTNFNLDPAFVDVFYSLTNTYNNPNISINDVLNRTIISGSDFLSAVSISLNKSNNSFTFIAYENGTVSNDIKITIPIYNDNGDILRYSRNTLINKINSLLSNTIAKGTKFITATNSNSQTFITIRPNINLTYNSNDYKVIFYDTISFVKCFVGASSVKNTTWDTTVGWILGFRNNSEYDLSAYSPGPNGVSILGDTGVCTNLFNYFLLCVDDYTQNHINDGLITITTPDTSVPLPSYADRSNFVCNPNTGTLTYNNVISNNTKLTQNQIYSLTQVANSQQSTSSNLTKGVSYTSFGKGPFVQDIFGLVPMKTSGLQPGSSYIEFGGTLQNQERIYFGPVNIHRMSVKLVTDRGDIVDLNNVNWSFSLVCEQLYKQKPGSKK